MPVRCREGGFREPGIAWWPGRIQAGKVTQAIASTMDIHPTLLRLAGVPPPPSLVMDGLDLSPVLFADYEGASAGNQTASGSTGTGGTGGGGGGHDCYFFYKYAVASDAANALAAVRCGAHKAFWILDSGPPAPLKPGSRISRANSNISKHAV